MINKIRNADFSLRITKEHVDKLKESGFRKDEISRFKNGNTAKLSKKRFAKMKLICFGKKENKPILITEAGITVKQVRVKINFKGVQNG